MTVSFFEDGLASTQDIDGQRKLEPGRGRHDCNGFASSAEDEDGHELERLALLRLGGVCQFERDEK